MPLSAHGPVSGLVLRSALVVLLAEARRPMTVAALCDGLVRLGLEVEGRPSKAVSDALRWEVARGRVVRVARGSYQLGHLPRTTAWRMRQRVAARVAVSLKGGTHGGADVSGASPGRGRGGGRG